MSDPAKDELGARFDEHRPDADTEDNMSNSSSTAQPDDSSSTDNTTNTGNAGNKPGPDPSTDATRDRRQVPMYLPDETADALNGLYERLDGRSKVEGQGGIEKHADFMEELADLAIEHEDELASRLGIEHK